MTDSQKDSKNPIKSQDDESKKTFDILLNYVIKMTAIEFHRAKHFDYLNLLVPETSKLAEENKPYSSNQNGFTPTSSYYCYCGLCHREVCCIKYSNHLNKCLGHGRNSSRVASKRISNVFENGTMTIPATSSDSDDWYNTEELRRPKR
ncbi:hypothetical protein A3Q56_02129 [Intoshia linei]|uniref:SAGA-associated factor 11 n=1 Tax=Intoshia linei TaxID=1819745 RepID=A0A177B742_9BILA|nr:hypothetical protein A3Q56_02129 [Intoshia linei]